MRRAGAIASRRSCRAAGRGWPARATDRYHVWNDDWTAGSTGSGTGIGTARAARQQRAGRRSSSTLDEGKPPAINGINGISQKGAQAGNASHYYSLTRMPTTGTIAIDGERFEVTGESWMDHEFGTSFLEPEQRGWDWLSIQLADGRELMLYQLRRADGSARSAIERHARRSRRAGPRISPTTTSR